MERKLVKISYGLPSFTPEWRAIRESCPNAGDVMGGCEIDSEKPTTHTWVCAVCKEDSDRMEKQLIREINARWKKPSRFSRKAVRIEGIEPKYPVHAGRRPVGNFKTGLF